jgi:hypothetical protein
MPAAKMARRPLIGTTFHPGVLERLVHMLHDGAPKSAVETIGSFDDR